MIEEENIGNLKNQEDVNPTSQLDKIAKEEDQESDTIMNATGSNNPVPTTESLIIKKEVGDQEDDEDKIDRDLP